MKTIEWNQSSARHDKIVIRAELRAGRIVMFQVDRYIAAKLPKYCIMHIGIKGHSEEEFFCDFRRLAAIKDNVTAKREKHKDDVEPVLIKSRHDDEYEGPFSIVYSIRRTENADRPWLGIDGWQESRYVFELTTTESADVSSIESCTDRKKSFSGTALIAVMSVALVACVVIVPFVLGSLGPDSASKRVSEKEVTDNQIASQGIRYSAAVKIDEEAVVPDKKVSNVKEKETMLPRSSRKDSHDKGHIARRSNENAPSVPCTQDMIDKGIACK